MPSTLCVHVSQLDVFTIDEIARAAGVPRAAVQRLVDTGEPEACRRVGTSSTRALRFMPGAKARQDAAAIAEARFLRLQAAAKSAQGQGFSAVASSLLHVAVLAALIWSTSGAVEMAATTPRERLVFLRGTGAGRRVVAEADGRRERQSLGIERPQTDGGRIVRART